MEDSADETPSSKIRDLISASLLATPDKHKCDENNNSNSTSSTSTATDAEKSSENAHKSTNNDSCVDDDRDEKSEKIKPKKMVGLFPLDLRSELKQRVGGGKSGFALKKSSTHYDVSNNLVMSEPISIGFGRKPCDRLKTEIKKKDDSDDEDGGVENLSFKEKLQLIERSSSRNAVNSLAQQISLAKSKSTSIVSQEASEAVKERLKRLNDLENKNRTASIDQTSSDEDNDKMRPEQESIAKNGSIAERLALLKNNGENNWRKRVTKKEVGEEIKRDSLVSDVLSSVTLRQKENEFSKPQLRQVKSVDIGASNLLDRLEHLKSNTEKWKNRVEHSDASNFKISNDESDDPPELPFNRDSTKSHPPMKVFKSDKIQSFKLSKSTSTAIFGAPQKTSVRTFTRSTSVQESNEAQPQNVKGLRIQLPTLDQGIDSFFPKAENSEQQSPESVDITDFDEIKVESTILSKRKITQGPKRRRPVSAMKALAQLRTDTISEYTELVQCDSPSPTDFKDTKKSKFTAEALAGLQATEDFTAVTLKSSSEPLNVTHLPYKSPMLIHIKGRRHVQCRLVPVKFSSLNDGDCFVLVTSEKLFNFIGRFANVIESKVCKDMCTSILRDKDLGCNANMLLSITERNLDGHNGKMFCKILERDEDEPLTSAGHSDEDELIEACLQETNMVYELQDDSLVPVEDFWCQVLTISMINSRKIFVLDFGSEVYVWCGKNALPDDKRTAMTLAEELNETPFDYNSCHLNPLDYSIICGHRKPQKDVKMNGTKRPEFAFLARVNQNMETILFKQKFSDWPDIKFQNKSKIPHVDCNEIDNIDGSHLFRSYVYEEPNLVLENSCLGRGNNYFDEDTRRYFEIITVMVKKWHANSDGNEELPNDLHQHFYATEAYTVLWKYQINITVRELSGKVSNRSTVGRDRYVYFNWQGKDATASEKGTSTLHMIELDKEKGSQMIIQQFTEIPAFVRLFKTIFIHKKRIDESRYDSWRMYLITGGSDINEAIALEVPCELQQLRSRACIFVVQGKNGQLVLWKGSKTSEQQQKVALSVCSKLCGKKYSEFFSTEKIRLREYAEGQESSEFFSALCADDNDTNREAYNSLLKHEESFDFTPKLYELTSTNGSFEAIEVVPGLRSKDHYTAFPFFQTDLYNARQPTLFLIDNGYALYLWQGWWPKYVEENGKSQDEVDVNNVENRAGENRWHLERCEAMQTAIDYWKTKCGHNEKYRKDVYIVTAGYEPIEFRTIFPEWIVHDDVVELNSQNPSKEMMQLDEYLTRFHQTTYPLDALLARPLPEYVNPTKLEVYLDDDDFEKTLGMTKDEWKTLPSWKKTNLRKEHGLF
ncbi:hypothetical protein ACKWTF_004132 [Chironomus riparius]